MPTHPPNILLITTDQQRTDTLGVYGSTHVRTPHIDRLAREGVVFERAYVQNTVCIPSRACMQTGRYTHQHGVRYMEAEIDTTPGLPDHEKTFMGLLQEHGYVTGATGKIHMMPERDFDWQEIVGGKGARWTQATGQDIGPAPLGKQYAEWLEERHPGGYEALYAQRRQPDYKRNRASQENILPLEEYVETYILEKSIEFMTMDHGKPFFLWCGFCGPHGPHDPPASHAHLYPFDQIQLPDTMEHDLSDRPPHLRHRGARAPLTPEQQESMRVYMSYYYCLCTLIDDYVGKLMEMMEARGLLENTLIIYTSDHGEMLGDFWKFGKGNFYEQVAHVPLIARPPGGCKGRRCTGLAEVMDLAPTILDYAGVDRPREMSAISFRPALEGGEFGHDSVLSEFTTNDQSINGKCLVSGTWKYVVWDTERGGELYDLESDPRELRNLYYDPRFSEVRDEMAEKLLTRLMRSEAGYNNYREERY
ncbi:MAG: sulfatase-like hydrolase/transferase [Lentisphaeria bacterium]|nr:sulfatase-like hydrolase/transferase [Lentisphaeria bacterium]